MSNLPWLTAQATWSDSKQWTEVQNGPTISDRNADLYKFTLGIVGKYLGCLFRNKSDGIDFSFAVREDSNGFIKLDVLGEMIVAGHSLPESLDRALSIAARADLLPNLPSFIRRVCSSFAPLWGVLRTRLV